MSSELSKQEYLKRYLENEKDADRKRKKKLKKKMHVSSLKIVDEDISLKALNFGEKVEEDEDDEKPVVAEIIDERPVEDRVRELYETSRWKKIDEKSCGTDSVAELGENGSKSVSLKENSNFCKNSYSKSFQNNPKKHRHDSDNDISPPRIRDNNPKSCQNSSKKLRHDSDSDLSPERSQSSSQKHRHDSDNDISPPRIQDRISRKRHDSRDLSPQRDKKRNHSDSDISPPRTYKERKIRNNRDSDSDISPPRTNKERKIRNKRDSDSDISPPRSVSELSNTDKTEKLGKTLSGLKSGLQNSKTLQKELQELREREKKQLNKLGDEISGRNAGTIIRDRKTGLKRDLNKEQQVKIEEDKKTKEYEQKYAQWGKGIEQTLEKKDKLMDDIYEMSKPLARYQDDEDLDERLKSIIHDEDPMSEYIKKKRHKDTPKYPVYTGPAAPPNRFGILPGYRWDGVDRSNGFEKKYFEKINKSKAVETEAYLWSVQDM